MCVCLFVRTRKSGEELRCKSGMRVCKRNGTHAIDKESEQNAHKRRARAKGRKIEQSSRWVVRGGKRWKRVCRTRCVDKGMGKSKRETAAKSSNRKKIFTFLDGRRRERWGGRAQCVWLSRRTHRKNGTKRKERERKRERKKRVWGYEAVRSGVSTKNNTQTHTPNNRPQPTVTLFFCSEDAAFTHFSCLLGPVFCVCFLLLLLLLMGRLSLSIFLSRFGSERSVGSFRNVMRAERLFVAFLIERLRPVLRVRVAEEGEDRELEEPGDERVRSHTTKKQKKTGNDRKNCFVDRALHQHPATDGILDGE